MKFCPTCRRTYTDTDLRFCMQDGMLLQDVETQTNEYLGDAPTVVLADTERTEILPPNEPVYRQQIPIPQSRATNNIVVPPPTFQISEVEPKSNTTKVVVVTTLGTLGLVSALGIGWSALSGRNKADVAAETNVNISMSNTRNANARANANASNANSNLNLNVNSNVNGNMNANLTNADTVSPSNSNDNVSANAASPTPKPTLAPEQAKKMRDELDGSLSRWRSATLDRDLDNLLTQYAPNVDYYRGGKMTVNQIRADKERAYNEFDTSELKITNVKVTPDPSGEKATVTFDKEWNMENDSRFNRGKVLQQLTYQRINGEWKIIGERDMKVYFNDKGSF